MAATSADLFLMANLSPLFTGLPFVVWISARGHAKHDIRLKVSKGPKANPAGKLITVALRPEIRVIGKEKLPAKDFARLRAWVAQNWDILLAYWNGEIFTETAIQSLRPIVWLKRVK